MSKFDKLIGQAENHLEPGEVIQQSVFGAYETKIMGNDSVRNGVLIATDKRIVFYAKKLTGFDLEVFPYANVSSIEMGKNLMGHNVSFFASGNKVSLKWIKQGDVAAFVSLVKNLIGKVQDSTVAVPQDDPVTLIKQLSELKDQGIITTEEFELKKKQLLGI